jgi:hypothetical protein
MQTSAIIQKIIDILERSEALLVPVEKLFLELKEDSDVADETVEGLIVLLNRDQRFQIIQPSVNEKADCHDDVLTKEEMEEAGLFRGPWVILKHRIPNRREIADILIQKADRTYETLKNAWEIRPRDNEEIEDRLLFALAKTQRLQHELRMIFGEKKS